MILSPAQRGHLAMLAFSALVAGSFSLGSIVARDVTPAALNAVRFWIAAAVLWGVIRAGGAMPGRRAFAAPWRYGVLGGLFAAYLVLMFEGLKTALPVATAAVFTLTPVMAAGFGWLVLRQRTTGRTALGLAIGAAGALWVIFRADLEALLALDIGRGEMIYFWGCVVHAVYTPLVRRLNRGESPLVFSFGMLVAGGILLTLWGAGDILATDWTGLRPIVWVTILYVAIFASAGTAVLLQFAALRLPASKVMAYTYLTPSWVILWEIALGRPLPPVAVLGGIGLTVTALAVLLKDEEG